MPDIDSQDLEEIIKQYSEIVIEEYESKLREYNGSVIYNEIANQIKQEILEQCNQHQNK